MELGVIGMMRISKPTTESRRLVLHIAALAQAAVLLFAGLTANAQEGNRLQDIQVQSLPGQRLELKLIMSETPGGELVQDTVSMICWAPSFRNTPSLELDRTA